MLISSHISPSKICLSQNWSNHQSWVTRSICYPDFDSWWAYFQEMVSCPSLWTFQLWFLTEVQFSQKLKKLVSFYPANQAVILVNESDGYPSSTQYWLNPLSSISSSHHGHHSCQWYCCGPTHVGWGKLQLLQPIHLSF